MAVHARRPLLQWHNILPMTQEDALDAIIRARIRGLRVARGWSLDALAARCQLSPSTLSRIETGHRRISIDQLVPIARALGTSLDQLVEPVGADDVVIRPRRDTGRGATTWMLTRADEPHGLPSPRCASPTPPPRRELRVHPGYGGSRCSPAPSGCSWASGSSWSRRGRRPSSPPCHRTRSPPTRDPAEVIFIFDRDGRRAHLDAVDLTDPDLDAVSQGSRARRR